MYLMSLRRLVFLIILGHTVVPGVTSNDEPCDTTNFLDDWQRSVAFATEALPICDNLLEEGWYRITSGAGDRMPTECPLGGFRCNTAKPIYLDKDDIPAGEDVYPAVGITVNRTAYAANYDGNCKHQSYDIQIKNCDGYFVYYLQPITGACSTGYCFGDQLPCPNDTRSDTGFTPGCETYPDVTVTPYVKSTLQETEKVNDFGQLMVYSRATFECHANDLHEGYTYTTRWFISDIEMKGAKLVELSKADVEGGLGRMMEEHWTPTFKPNFLVKCAMQIGGNGFETSGPRIYSDNFFAGLKINQNVVADYVVLEGEQLQIPVQLTMPLSCSWPKTISEAIKNHIQSVECLLVLLNGIPSYQTENDPCLNGISKDGIIFESETCGVKFSHANWQEPQVVKINGQSDLLVNINDRIVFLRLYNSDDVTPIKDLIYWSNIHLPDIKVIVKDKDFVTLGTSCYSQNDPHMMTFDGKSWELQISNGLTEGEYIMYTHDRLPQQVSVYFRKCSSTVLCNCGVAVRSADSLFVANFCTTTYEGRRKVNRYMKQRLCDDQSLIIEKTSTSYTITLPTGTKVTFNYGTEWIDGIQVKPSILDADITKGLCGVYNGDVTDDFLPRGQFAPTTSEQIFAESWQVKGDIADDTLFNPNGKIKKTEYFGQQYCTCVSPDNNYPHGSPDFNCELTSIMETCRGSKTADGVFTASCSSRSKRSVTKSEQEDDEPPSYPMIVDDSPSEIIVESWQNGWTEESAREHCTLKFESAPAFNICSEYASTVDTSPYITGCIADIKSTGGDSWLKVTIKNYASACLQEAKMMEILTVTNSTNSTGSEKSILSIIKESTCPENCSDNGICSDGQCNCLHGFYGELCGLTLTQAPYIEKDAVDDLCDTNKKRCHSFVIPGRDFIESDSLTCKFTQFSLKSNGTSTTIVKQNTYTNAGTYSSSFLMYCKLPESRKKRSVEFEVLATGYYISVSNNGDNYTDPLTTLVYDSVCYECNTTSMTCVEQDTCPIKETVLETNKEPINIIMIAGVSGAVVAILIISIVAVCLWKHLRPKKSYIRDSTMSIPTACTQVAPKAHFHTNNVFTSDSNLIDHKYGW